MRKYAFMAVVTILMWLASPISAHAQKRVFVGRHAERADGGMMQAQTDPSLAAAGEARASKLAVLLGEAGIKGIYATGYRRTQETAKPLATKLGLQIQQVVSKDLDGLLRKIRTEHARDFVLITGHSNTVPEIIKALGGPEVIVPDSEYDALFLVVPGTGVMAKIKYTW